MYIACCIIVVKDSHLNLKYEQKTTFHIAMKLFSHLTTIRM